MLEDRKRANRRNSLGSGQYLRAHSLGAGKPRAHRPLSRSKAFSHTFDKLFAAASPSSSVCVVRVEGEGRGLSRSIY